MGTAAYRDVFRGLSLGRRHGVLTAHDAKVSIDVLFQEGHIVAARSSEHSPVLGVIRRLVDAKILAMDDARRILPLCSSTEQLFTEVVSGLRVEGEVFLKAKRAHELDVLHRLASLEAPLLRFVSRTFRPDQRFSFRIAPGQFLLDLIEQDHFNDKFAELRGHAKLWLSSQAGVSRDVRLGEIENEVMRAFCVSDCVDEVLKKLLRSEYEVLRAVMNLCQLTVLSNQEHAAQTSTPVLDDESETFDDDELSLLAGLELLEDGGFDGVPQPGVALAAATPGFADSGDVGSAVNADIADAISDPSEQVFSVTASGRFELPTPSVTRHSFAIEYEAWAGILLTLCFLLCTAVLLPERIEQLFSSVESAVSTEQSDQSIR